MEHFIGKNLREVLCWNYILVKRATWMIPKNQHKEVREELREHFHRQVYFGNLKQETNNELRLTHPYYH